MNAPPTSTPDAADAVVGTEQAELRHGAIGLAQSTVISIASSAPGQATAVSIAGLIVASSYAGGLAILLTTGAMLAIAVAYQRLNLWKQSSGGAYAWVGRAVSPYLGFLVGWIMLAGYVLGTVSDILPIGPSMLSLLGIGDVSSEVGELVTATLLGGGIAALALFGIQLTARFQMAIAAIEYVILVAFCLIGFYVVFIDQAAGTVQPGWDWFSPSGVGGAGSLAGGMLIAVYLFTGWDTAVYLSEESERPEVNPGKAAIIAVAALGVFYTLLVVSLQGAASQQAIEAHSDSALIFIARELVGSPWDKVMALAIVLSVLGTTQAFLVSAARISYSMGRDRVIPSAFGRISRRYRTPGFATVLFGVLTILMVWLYVLISSVGGAFDTVVSTVGVLFAIFYAVTGVATTWYYRRIVSRSATDLLLVGVLPPVGAGVLLWIAVKSVADFSQGAIWSLVAIGSSGILMMLVARFVYRAPLFSLAPVAYEPGSRGE